jgi:predicted PurR-regulated permease PerM
VFAATPRRTITDMTQDNQRRAPQEVEQPHGGDERWLTTARLASLVGVLLAAYAALMVVQALRGVLIMLGVALFLSFAMEPAVQFLARRGWRRGLATGAVFLLVVIASAGTIAAFVPLIVDQVSGLIRSIPGSISELNQLLDGLPFDVDLEASPELRREIVAFSNEIGDRFSEVALGAAGNVVNIGATAVGIFVRLLAIGFITFYLVADGPRLRQTLARPLAPDRQREMLAIWELAVAKTGGYIYSRLFIGLASAIVHTLFLLVLGIPFALPLGLWMGGMTAFVPLVGVYLGGLLLVVVAAVNEPVHAIWVLGFITVYQQVENYVLAPKVQAHTMDLHPAVAFTSVLVGATLLGAVGALLALPVAAITQALLSTYVRRNELIDELAEVPLLPEPVEPPVPDSAAAEEPEAAPEEEPVG